MYGYRPILLITVMLLSLSALGACGGGGGGDDDQPGSNANLTSLLVANALLDPAFASGTLNYQASVSGGTTETRVTAFTTSSRARLTINGAAVASGTASSAIPLGVGTTDVEVIVTAEDGTRRTYTVAINRPVPGSDARLSSLALSAGTLVQPFDPDQLNYDAAFGYLAASTRVLATPVDPQADGLSLNGQPIDFGIPSEPVPLTIGTDATALEAVVTAEDDTSTRAYRIDVSRAPFNILAQSAYIKSSNTNAGDAFGTSLALSGDTLLVGAPDEQSLSTGVDGNQADNSGNAVGAAYLYTRMGGTWDPAHYLKSGNADAGDRFGASVAAARDLLAIGAPGEQSLTGDPADNSGSTVGAVYLFDPDLAGTTEQIAYLKAGNADDQDRFGTAIALSEDRVLVGAPFEASNATGVNGDGSDNSLINAGAAYLFESNGAGFGQTTYLKASNSSIGTDNQFGNALALSGNTIAIAAWQENGGSAGIDGDQSDTSAPRSGAVYLFHTDDGDTWQQSAYVKASNPGQDHYFGAAVALDGNRLAVGAPGEDTGANGAGAVYLFVRDDTGTWTEEAMLKADVVGLNDAFGTQVALAGDLLIVGAPGERADAIGINGGDSNENAVDSGAVYLFERDNSGDWNQSGYVKASNTDAGDAFGSALGFSGDTLAIAAPAEQSAGTDVGGNETDNTLNAAGAAYLLR